MTLSSRAISIFIDNSAVSINGDFIPNRLEAQKTTIDRLSSYYFSSNPETQIAVGTLGSSEFGIRVSFTSDYEKLISSIQNISCGGILNLERGIKSALLSLKYCNRSIKEKNILLFIGSEHNLTMNSVIDIINIFKKENISLDIVLFGQNIKNTLPLKKLCKEIQHSHYLEILQSNTVLSDNVLQSDIRRGKDPSKMNSKELVKCAKNDPELLNAILLSQYNSNEILEISPLINNNLNKKNISKKKKNQKNVK